MNNVWRDMEEKGHSLLNVVAYPRGIKEVNFPSLGLLSRKPETRKTEVNK
jgi:hypothetical protein